jgi:hypothetical protein
MTIQTLLFSRGNFRSGSGVKDDHGAGAGGALIRVTTSEM